MPEKPIIPFVHMNGTSLNELLALRENFYSALDAAYTALKQMAPNGRDFYPDPGRMERALEQHRRRQQAIQDLQKEIELECELINELEK